MGPYLIDKLQSPCLSPSNWIILWNHSDWKEIRFQECRKLLVIAFDLAYAQVYPCFDQHREASLAFCRADVVSSKRDVCYRIGKGFRRNQE